jgi:hypothetical protein
LTAAETASHAARMELIVYALALVFLAGLVIASRRGNEPRHVDPDLLVEMPPLDPAVPDRDRRRPA